MMTPWDTICLDLVGPYTTDKSGIDIIPTAIFVDSATGWFKIAEISDESSVRFSVIFISR